MVNPEFYSGLFTGIAFSNFGGWLFSRIALIYGSPSSEKAL
jgi:hypothetical protein